MKRIGITAFISAFMVAAVMFLTSIPVFSAGITVNTPEIDMANGICPTVRIIGKVTLNNPFIVELVFDKSQRALENGVHKITISSKDKSVKYETPVFKQIVQRGESIDTVFVFRVTIIRASIDDLTLTHEFFPYSDSRIIKTPAAPASKNGVSASIQLSKTENIYDGETIIAYLTLSGKPAANAQHTFTLASKTNFISFSARKTVRKDELGSLVTYEFPITVLGEDILDFVLTSSFEEDTIPNHIFEISQPTFEDTAVNGLFLVIGKIDSLQASADNVLIPYYFDERSTALRTAKHYLKLFDGEEYIGEVDFDPIKGDTTQSWLPDKYHPFFLAFTMPKKDIKNPRIVHSYQVSADLSEFSFNPISTVYGSSKLEGSTVTTKDGASFRIASDENDSEAELSVIYNDGVVPYDSGQYTVTLAPNLRNQNILITGAGILEWEITKLPLIAKAAAGQSMIYNGSDLFEEAAVAFYDATALQIKIPAVCDLTLDTSNVGTARIISASEVRALGDFSNYTIAKFETSGVVEILKRQAKAFTLSRPFGSFFEFEIISEDIGDIIPQNLKITFGEAELEPISVSEYQNGRYLILVSKQTGNGEKVLSVTMGGILKNHIPFPLRVETPPIDPPTFGKTDIKNTTIIFENNGFFPYTGEAIEPAFIIKDNVTPLIPNVDFTFSFRNNIEIGTAVLELISSGEVYEGVADIPYRIVFNSPTLFKKIEEAEDVLAKYPVHDMPENKVDFGRKYVSSFTYADFSAMIASSKEALAAARDYAAANQAASLLTDAIGKFNRQIKTGKMKNSLDDAPVDDDKDKNENEFEDEDEDELLYTEGYIGEKAVSGARLGLDFGITSIGFPVLEAKQVHISSPEASPFLEATAGYAVANFFDLKLFDGAEPIHELEGGQARIELPFIGDPELDYIALHYNDDGSVSELPAFLSDGKIIFHTREFSLFAIAVNSQNPNLFQNVMPLPQQSPPIPPVPPPAAVPSTGVRIFQALF